MAQLNDNPIRVGLLGAGTVGSQTARLLVEQKDELAARIGRPIELVGVACRTSGGSLTAADWTALIGPDVPADLTCR